MSKLPDDSNRVSSANSHKPQSDSIYLIMSMADTTWRMFVPAVGFTLLGAWADNALGTKPALMFIGIVVGAALAFLLVKKQIDLIKREKQ